MQHVQRLDAARRSAEGDWTHGADFHYRLHEGFPRHWLVILSMLPNDVTRRDLYMRPPVSLAARAADEGMGETLSIYSAFSILRSISKSKLRSRRA